MLGRPTIEGRLVTLRPLGPGDIDGYHALLSDAEGLRLTGTQRTFTREEAAGWLASLAGRDDRADLAVLVRETGELAGEVVLNDYDPVNRLANVRIGLRAPFTGRGYGREALRLVVRYAFEEARLHRLELGVFSFNPRALHVYRELGFREEGRRREVLLMDGAYHDSIEMSILEQEYRSADYAD